MYIPAPFEITDREILLDFAEEMLFGVLVSGADITHLPYIVLDRGEGAGGSLPRLFAHFAGDNPHADWIGRADAESVLIVTGPHSYISPKVYVNQTTVPTWDFITVHLHGNLRVVAEAEIVPLMRRQVRVYEGEAGWTPEGLPEGYFEQLATRVRPFYFDIGRFEGKFKLNQNKLREDVEAVIAHLRDGRSEQQALARWMERVTLHPGRHR